MGNFRSNDRSEYNRGSGRSRLGGRSSGGFGDRDRGDRGRGRGFGDRGARRPLEMNDVTCDKCGKECQVPFRPTGGKPVYCSECFRASGNAPDSGSRNNFSRNQDRQTQSTKFVVSSEQFNQLNEKLDKVLAILESLEVIEDEEIEEELDDEDEEEVEEELEDDTEEEEEETEDEDSEEDSKKNYKKK